MQYQAKVSREWASVDTNDIQFDYQTYYVRTRFGPFDVSQSNPVYESADQTVDFDYFNAAELTEGSVALFAGLAATSAGFWALLF